MDTLKELQILGIKRNLPPGLNDGACEEIINTRYKNGAWRPIGTHEVLYDKPDYSIIKIHKQDNIHNWIGYNSSTDAIEHYNPETLEVIQLILTLDGSESINKILFLKRFLIVITTKNIYRILYDEENGYGIVSLTGIDSLFSTTMSKGGYGVLYTEWGTDAEALLGKYYKNLREESDKGYLTGAIFYRIALRLFDGTYILHSTPIYHQSGRYDIVAVIKSGYAEEGYQIKIPKYEIESSVTFIDTTGSHFEELSEIIDSVVLFSSQNQQFWDISEETITDENLNILFGYFNNISYLNNGQTVIGISDSFKEDMYDSISWYKIGEIQMSELVQQSAPDDDKYTGDFDIDIDGFYQNYATRETLTIDSFSHHGLTGNASKIYNDRLMIGDTLQSLAVPFIESYRPAVNPRIFSDTLPAGYQEFEFDELYECKVQVFFDTSNGDKVVEQDLEIEVFRDVAESNNKAVFFRNVIGYPDSRAKRITINIVYGVYIEMLNTNMESSEFHNYSYVVNKNFNTSITPTIEDDPRIVGYNFDSYPIVFTLGSLPVSNIVPVNDEIISNNSWEISEVTNPFVFPVENSNQVSSGIILGFGVNTENLGVSQFGQFPIIIFTSLGKWIAEIGVGESYVTRIVPLDGDVIRDNNASLDLAFGVAYITLEGLKIASGKEVVQISSDAEGVQSPTFIDNEDFIFQMNNASLVELVDYADKVSFEEYLTGAVLGYNKGIDNNELIVANPNYIYAYIYNLTHKNWYKITDKYTLLVPNYPELYAVRTKRSGLSAPYSESHNMVNISNEVPGNTQFAIITRPISFDSPDTFKKLRRTFVRCSLSSYPSKHPAAYIYSSDDLFTWKFVTGNDVNTGSFNDIWITHSMNSARYYIIVITGDISVSEGVDNRINNIQVEVALKMQDKLR